METAVRRYARRCRAQRVGHPVPARNSGKVSLPLCGAPQAQEAVNLIPVQAGISLITVLPEQLQSPLLTAEWEQRLKQVGHGELSADTFLSEISDMVSELVNGYEVIRGAETLFPSGRPVVGKCPRCGCNVTESKKGYFCESTACHFGLWRDNKFLTAKKISLTKKMATSLLKDGTHYAAVSF